MKLNRKIFSIAGFLMTGLLLIGCQTAKIQERIILEQTPGAYFEMTNREDSTIAILQWEEFFQDQALKDLIALALANNQENLKTLERIKLAGADFKIARVGMLPEINGIAGASRRRFGDYTMDGVGNADSFWFP